MDRRKLPRRCWRLTLSLLSLFIASLLSGILVLEMLILRSLFRDAHAARLFLFATLHGGNLIQLFQCLLSGALNPGEALTELYSGMVHVFFHSQPKMLSH